MTKKCIVCNEVAEYKIKDTPDFYCHECATENFADLSLLLRLDEEAYKLNEAIKERLKEELEKKEKDALKLEHGQD